MNRPLLLPTLLALGLVAGAGGCGRDNLGSVALKALCFPPTPDATTGACPFTPTCTQVLADGRLFVDLQTSGGTLVYPIQIDNLRPDNSDAASGRTNTNFAVIERFDMKYQATGFGLPAAFANQTATVPAAGSTVVVVDLVPAAAGAALMAALPAGPTGVVVQVSAHGHYGDDTPFDTAEYAVPVDVSHGVIGPFVCADPTKKVVGVCPQQGQTAVALCQ